MGRLAEDAISRAIYNASEIRRRDKNERILTPEQRDAWENLIDKLGESAKMLEYASTRDLAEAGVKAMMEEADKLMSNPSVRKAYEHFQLVCELTREHNES